MERQLFEEVVELEKKVKNADLPEDLESKTLGLLDRLLKMAKFGGYLTEFDRTANYVDWIISLPWHKQTKDILDIKYASRVFEKKHYGLQEVKERILEYLAVLKLREKGFSRAPILCLVGLVGTGKTTLAYSIAEAMGRKFGRIPFGGMADPLDLRGQSKIHAEAEPGQMIKSLKRCGSRNPVILLDEIDRVSEEKRADIMGVLVELLDPEQNENFIDHFIDFPFNLSQVLFVTTCNNTTNIATAVLDRLELLQMPSYSDEEKIAIGKNYILPQTIKNSGIAEGILKIDDDVWPKIVRPLGFDAGIRTLQRTIQGICRKTAKLIVSGNNGPFHLTIDNFKQYLPS